MVAHLILFGVAVSVVSSLSSVLARELQYYYKDTVYDHWQYTSCFYFDLDLKSQSVADWYFNMMKVKVALSVMLLVLHFALFLMSSIERAQIRKYEKRIIYLVAAPSLADGRMYYTPLPQSPQEDIGSIPAPQPFQHSQEDRSSGG